VPKKPLNWTVEGFDYLRVFGYFVDFCIGIWYIFILRANPCGVRIESMCLKEPIPVLREIRPWWIGQAYSIGLSDISNDCPLGSNGFFSNAFLRHSRRRATQ